MSSLYVQPAVLRDFNFLPMNASWRKALITYQCGLLEFNYDKITENLVFSGLNLQKIIVDLRGTAKNTVHLILPEFIRDISGKKVFDFTEFAIYVYNSHHFLKRVGSADCRNKRIGITGFADALLMMNIDYNSVKASQFFRNICAYLIKHSVEFTMGNSGSNDFAIGRPNALKTTYLISELDRSGCIIDLDEFLTNVNKCYITEMGTGITSDGPCYDFARIYNYTSPGIHPIDVIRDIVNDDIVYGYSYLSFIERFHLINGIDMRSENYETYYKRCKSFDVDVFLGKNGKKQLFDISEDEILLKPSESNCPLFLTILKALEEFVN